MEQLAEQGRATPKKVWDSVKHYTVRCGACAKWRLIPTKDKYEEIREKITEQPFVCETARAWRPDITCEDAEDVKDQDANLRWAMDRPKIPKTPRGWQRILRVRAEGGSKFADVYYISPSNKRFRSMVELNTYINDSPRYIRDGLNLSQFSFQPPVPLDESYIAKRRARMSDDRVHANNVAPYENKNARIKGKEIVLS